MRITHLTLAALFCMLLFSTAFAPPPTGNELKDFVVDVKDYTKNAADTTLGWLWTQGSCEDLTPMGGGQYTGIGLLNVMIPSFTVILAVLFFVGCVYILGQFLQSPQLIALAKDELWQSFWSVLRVFVFLGITYAPGLWFTAVQSDLNTNSAHAGIYEGSPSLQHVDLAMTFSKNMVFRMSENIGFLLIYNTILHTIYSATMWVGVTWRAMWSFNLGPVLKPLIDLIGMALQLQFVAVGEWIIHLVTLCAIKKWSFSLFIPLALVIRSFPPTRGGGDAMLALFFAFACFYPMMFVIDAEVYRITEPYLSDSGSILSSFFSGGIFGTVGLLAVVMLLLGGAFVPFMLNGAVAIAFELVKNSVYYIVIMGFVLPFINIFVTLTAARETAKSFGVDVNYMAFIRLI